MKPYHKILLIIASIMLLVSPVFAAYPETLPKNMPEDVRWVFSRAGTCLHSDNIHRIAANGECLAMQTYFADGLPNKNPILLIFIHGDGIPGGAPSDYLKFQATKFSTPNTVPIVLIRPGYYDSYDNYSTGESYAFSNHGYPADSYRPETVATLAAAVANLKSFYHPRCTILVGHSGGAAMSGIILGKYPHLVNGAVMASVVGDVQKWATKHNWGSYAHSLSPNAWVEKIPKESFVYIVSGTKDENTYPSMSKEYYDLLKQQGIEAFWYPVENGDHNSVVITKPDKFNQAITDALQLCPAPGSRIKL